MNRGDVRVASGGGGGGGVVFFFNATAATEIYTLTLHDALPISVTRQRGQKATWSQGNAVGMRAIDVHLFGWV